MQAEISAPADLWRIAPYYHLCDVHSEFGELFRVEAGCDLRMDRMDETEEGTNGSGAT